MNAASSRPGLLRRIARTLCTGTLLLAAGAAAGMVRCTDAWGRQYVLPQQVSESLAGMRCVAGATDTGGGGRDAPQLGTPEARAAGVRGSLLVIPDSVPKAGWLGLAPMRNPSSGTFTAPVDSELRALIHRVALDYGHDPQLLNAIIHVESRFNAAAVSPKGAIGLMQVMPATARRMGVQDPARALLDPGTNLRAGARYLRLLWDMFADRPELAIAAYNAGEGAVLRHGRQVPPYPETRNYVVQVLHALESQRAGVR